MFGRRILSFGLIAVLVAVAVLTPVGGADTAQAVTASQPRFRANCAVFGLDIAVNGTNDDGGGFDKFRYLITDGNGKKLYLEDASRRVGVTFGSNVASFSFDNDGVDGPPARNPIRFYLIDLDANNNQLAILQTATYTVGCLPAEPSTNPVPDYVPPRFLKGVFRTTAEVYAEPGRYPTGVRVEQGKEHYVVYRSADNGWVAVDISGDQLVWVPTAAVAVDINRLNVQPFRIDGADPTQLINNPSPTLIPTPGGGGVPPIVGAPVTTAIVNVNLRMRASPSLRGQVLLVIPAQTSIPVYGRNGARNFIRVSYNGIFGWVSSGFVTLLDRRVSELPVVQ